MIENPALIFFYDVVKVVCAFFGERAKVASQRRHTPRGRENPEQSQQKKKGEA
jgi:hypothetical protein